VVPISDWIDGLGQISPVVEPLISRSLLAAAEVRRAHAVRIGAEFPIAGFREFYLDRDAFAQADSALNDLGAVLLVGKPKSGKTRLAWNLVHQNPNAVVVLPIDTEPPTLNSPCGLEGCDVFLVIDDIQKSAQGLNVLSWWRHLKMLSARCRLICTCGDGDDWEFVQKNQALLVRMLDPAGLVFTSRVGSQGADETPTWGWRLAQSLGLTWKEFTDRFDGTPGSLVLDLSDMKRRYEKLANEWFAGIPASRLLDAVKLLKYGQQPRYREPVIRAAAGRILGKTEISDEVWRTLVRRTTEEGFGWMVSSNTSIERALATYGPYLNVCVTYEQNDAHVTELIDVLVDQNDGHGLLYLGSAFPFDKADLAIRAYTESAKLGYTPAYVGLGRLYGSPLVGQYKTAEAMLREAIKRGNEDASYELGWVYARMRKYRAAEKAFRVLVDAGATEVNFVLANVLARQKSREGEAEAAYRAAIQVGYYDAYLGLGLLLSGQPGREKDAEDAFWAAARLLNDSAALLFAAAVKNGNRLSATPPDDLFGAGPNAFGIVVHPKQSRQPVFRRLRTNLLKLLGRASPHNDQP